MAMRPATCRPAWRQPQAQRLSLPGWRGRCLLAARFSGPPRRVRCRSLGPDRAAYPNPKNAAGRSLRRTGPRASICSQRNGCGGAHPGAGRFRLHSVRRETTHGRPCLRPAISGWAYGVWARPRAARRFIRRGARLVRAEPERRVPPRRGAVPGVRSDRGEERILSRTSLDAVNSRRKERSPTRAWVHSAIDDLVLTPCLDRNFLGDHGPPELSQWSAKTRHFQAGD